ncbi:F-box/LRR-repeat protein 8-like [Branchiostoma floridae x Branchiostoma belcheri]
MEEISWENLTDHIVIHILSYLPAHHRPPAGAVCRAWNRAFNSPLLWRHVRVTFHSEKDTRWLGCLKRYGTHFRTVHIDCNQENVVNRRITCDFINGLARLPERRLKRFIVIFSGMNPYFYAGQEMHEAIEDLFGPPPTQCNVISTLEHVDLGKLSIAYSDKLFLPLAENNPNLRFLNIQNASLVCKVTSDCLLKIITTCTKLVDLRVHYYSLSEEVLTALADKDRTPLEHLSVCCQKDDKMGFAKVWESEFWMALTEHNRALRVSLIFGDYCPTSRIPVLLKPEIPVSVLRVENWHPLLYLVRFCCEHYYMTIEVLVLHTHPSPQLDQGLLELVTKSPRLRELHVYCVLAKDTVAAILKLRPGLQRITLKSEKEPFPWEPEVL